MPVRQQPSPPSLGQLKRLKDKRVRLVARRGPRRVVKVRKQPVEHSPPKLRREKAVADPQPKLKRHIRKKKLLKVNKKAINQLRKRQPPHQPLLLMPKRLVLQNAALRQAAKLQVVVAVRL